MKEFVADATPEIVDDSEKGIPMLQMVVTSGNGRETLFLNKGEVEIIGPEKHKLGFEAKEEGIINRRASYKEIHYSPCRSEPYTDMAIYLLFLYPITLRAVWN